MRSAVLAGAAVFVVALAALAGLRSGTEDPPLPRAQAAPAALRSPAVKSYLASNGWDESHVLPLDESDWRVTFTDGPRIVLDVAVGPRGEIRATQQHSPDVHPTGSTIAWAPGLLLLLTAVFVFALAGSAGRTRDAAVIAAGMTMSILLHDERLVGPHVFVGAATLAFIAFRCAQVAVTGTSEDARDDPGRERILGLLGVGLVVAGVAVIVTSTGASDVAFANLLGATQLNHGSMPYGNLPTEVVHGDTYPLLSYILYMPVAAIEPVRDSFDSLDGALWLNALAYCTVALLLLRTGGRRHAVAWLAFPAVMLAASGGGNDTPAAVFVAASLLTVSAPLRAAALLGLAGWVKVVPAVALLPLGSWSRRPALVFAVPAALLALGVAVLAATGALGDAWSAMRFQFVRGSWYSIWQQAGARWFQVVFQAAVLGFAAGLALHVRRSTATPTARQVAAFAGCLIALLQLSANYWTWAYLPWLLPFVLVALFPTERRRSRPPAPHAP